MTAVLQVDRRALDRPVLGHYAPSARPRPVPSSHRHPRPRPARRPAPAVFRRRRIIAALAGLGLVLTVARAGAAFNGPTLAAHGRLPHVQTVIVQPGDSLWSVAHRLAPKSDPRAVVDALIEARGTSTVSPGESVTWLEP